MRYEKKMLILTGEGKGVVLIEKSGLGVKFAIRTFGISVIPLKVGIISRTGVYVRDLPSTVDPSAVFFIDGIETEDLHIAVFDRKLRLYGTFSKTKMWEANVMGLVGRREEARLNTRLPERAPALPPIVEKPTSLPLPDGRGIVQTRDALYGDEALAENDFYTPFDISARMPVVDEFLDSPRTLDANAVEGIEANKEREAVQASENAQEVPAPENNIQIDSADGDESESQNEESPPVSEESGENEREEGDIMMTEDVIEEAAASSLEDGATISEPAHSEEIEKESDGMESEAEKDDGGVSSETMTDAASVSENEKPALDKSDDSEGANDEEAETTACLMPWEAEARYLSGRSKRNTVEKPEKITPPSSPEAIKHIRDAGFLERCRADIDSLFSSAPRDKELSALLPDIEWVKVEFDGRAVSVGRTQVFLCYAVFGQYEKIPPLGEETQWLPRVRTAPTGKGYWLIFQDLCTGEIIHSI